MKEGYAPFCKHLFVENFTEALSGALKITKDNERFLRSGYEARTEYELPVLTRWFDRELLERELGFSANRAAYLDIILYSKEQIQAENEARNAEDPNKEIDYDYGIVSVKP